MHFPSAFSHEKLLWVLYEKLLLFKEFLEALFSSDFSTKSLDAKHFFEMPIPGEGLSIFAPFGECSLLQLKPIGQKKIPIVLTLTEDIIKYFIDHNSFRC